MPDVVHSPNRYGTVIKLISEKTSAGSSLGRGERVDLRPVGRMIAISRDLLFLPLHIYCLTSRLAARDGTIHIFTTGTRPWLAPNISIPRPQNWRF